MDIEINQYIFGLFIKYVKNRERRVQYVLDIRTIEPLAQLIRENKCLTNHLRNAKFLNLVRIWTMRTL